MDEAAWLSSTDPTAMLAFLRGEKAAGWRGLLALFSLRQQEDDLAEGDRASDRKLRLFAGACCRRLWPLLTDERSRGAIEASERFADGLADGEELRVAHEQAWAAAGDQEPATAREILSVAWGTGAETGKSWGWAARAAAEVASPAVADALRGLGAVDRAAVEWGMTQPDPREVAAVVGAHVRADLLRDIFGNPFRPVALDPAWLTPAVLALARSAYEERTLPEGLLDPGCLGVLADALEEAGCNQAGVLGHLRGPGPHVRGCFAVDLCLSQG